MNWRIVRFTAAAVVLSLPMFIRDGNNNPSMQELETLKEKIADNDGIVLFPNNFTVNNADNNVNKVIEKITPVIQNNLIDLNAAGKKELAEIPGIGEILAERIVSLRDEKKEFQNLDELLDVKGIGKKEKLSRGRRKTSCKKFFFSPYTPSSFQELLIVLAQ